MPGSDLSPGCCRVYTGSDFSGDSREICSDSGSLKGKWNNNIESWECGPNAIAQFCIDLRSDYYETCEIDRWTSFAGSNSSNSRMNLMNLVSTIFVDNIEGEDFEMTTAFTSDDCSGHSVFMPILGGPWFEWDFFLAEVGQESRSYKSVFLPPGSSIVLTYWDNENEK